MIRRPKILFLHQGGELYGSDIIFYQVVEALSLYVEPVVVLDSTGPLVKKLREISGNIMIRELGVLRRKCFNVCGMLQCIYLIIRSTLWLAKYIKRNNILGVYSNTIGILPGAFAAKLLGTPHIWHIHEIIVKPRYVARLLSFLVLVLSKKVVANSNAVARYLSQGLPINSEKITVVHNGISIEPFDTVNGNKIRKEFSIGSKKILIGIIGRIHYFKGQDYFLDTAYVMKGLGFKDFKALIVGDVFKGYEWLREKLIMKVRSLGLEQNVLFCGYRRNIPEILKAIDILIVPSILPESFGLIILEAMAACKPVIATALGGPLEIMEDSVTGFLVPPNNPEIMAEKIIKLALDKALREQMGKLGRQRAKERFSESMFRDNIQNLLLEVISS